MEPPKDITLKQYYAIMALNGMLSNSDNMGELDEFLHDSWTYANSMIKYEKKKEGKK